jgi:ABC-type transporter Mla MlaB component
MLKIARSATPDAVVFFLSGRIDQTQLAGLQAAVDAETDTVKLDLREVTRVDREAVPTLARWASQGIELLNCPAYIRRWLNKAMI